MWQGTELCPAVLAEPLSFFLSLELLCPWKGDQRGQEETSLQAPVCWILGAHRSCSGSTGLGALEGQRGILWLHGYTLHNRKPGKKWQFSQICQSAFKKIQKKIPTFSRGLLICSGSSSNNTSLSDRDPDFCSRTQTGKVRGGPIVSPFMFTSLPHKHRSFLMIRAVQRTETNLAGSLSVLLFLCLIEPETESQI